MAARDYWLKPELLDGKWKSPAVQSAKWMALPYLRD